MKPNIQIFLRLIAIAIVRVLYIDGAINAIDPTLGSVDSSLTTEALLHYSLIAATVPCLKPFVVAFNTGWGQGDRKASNYAFRDSVGTSKRISQSARRESLLPRQLTEEHCEQSTGAIHESLRHVAEAEPETVENEENQRMIIQQTRSWEVEHETYELTQYAPQAAQGRNETTC